MKQVLMKQVRVITTLYLEDDADIEEVINEMDYSFVHKSILESDIFDYYVDIVDWQLVGSMVE